MIKLFGTAMLFAVISAAALGLLVFVLGFWVSIERTRSKVITGAPDPASSLAKTVRAHGNATEYAPTLMVLLLIVGVALERDMSRDPAAAGPVVWLMLVVTASRFIHAAGFLLCETLEKPHVLKAIGAIVTYVGGAALSIVAIASVLQPA
ncbi:MAG: MAPEG family protein [Pseudomonadota bacterium]